MALLTVVGHGREGDPVGAVLAQPLHQGGHAGLLRRALGLQSTPRRTPALSARLSPPGPRLGCLVERHAWLQDFSFGLTAATGVCM